LNAVLDSDRQWRRNRRRVRPLSITPAIEPTPRVHLSASKPPDLKEFFDAIYFISLKDEQTKRREFQAQLAACDWPFGPVQTIDAINGDRVGIPEYFHQGGGAYGCLQSHRHALEDALMRGHKRILVMEDDADLRPRFGLAVRNFLELLGDETWDCLMLGGQVFDGKPHRPNIIRATEDRGIQRTHCMAFQAQFIRELYRHWSMPLDKHCDWSLGPFAAKYRTFAPEPFIVGQRGGLSRITWRMKAPEWWNRPTADAPVVWLKCPRPVIEATRDIFHAGNRRNPEGVCLGLADVFDRRKNPTEADQSLVLRGWIEMIQWEVESLGNGSVCTIWSPHASEAAVMSVTGGKATVFAVNDPEEARRLHTNLRLGCPQITAVDRWAAMDLKGG
jgi:hypothetical protein